MSFFQRIKGWIPHPFKYIRNKLNIQAEWTEFMEHIRPHRYKIYIATIIVTYPFYRSYIPDIKNYAKNHINRWLGNTLKPQEPPFQIAESFSKNLVKQILADEHVRFEGLQFVNHLIKDQKFVADILQLLLSALKSSQFLSGLKQSSKDIVLTTLADPQIDQALKKKVVQIVSSDQVRAALIKLIQEAFSSKQSVETLVNLLTKGIVHQNVKKSLSQSVGFAVRQLLVDEQTLNQLKIFIFFLLRKFQNDDEIKGMMDILFAKGLGLTKKKKQTDLQKLLKSKVKKSDAVA